MSDPKDKPVALRERIERIMEKVEKTRGLKTLYAILRAELGTMKRQFPEVFKDVEPLKPREDIYIEMFADKVLTGIRGELERFQQYVAEGLREIGQHAVDYSSQMSEDDKKIRESKIKKLKYLQGIVKGLTLTISIIEQISREA